MHVDPSISLTQVSAANSATCQACEHLRDGRTCSANGRDHRLNVFRCPEGRFSFIPMAPIRQQPTRGWRRVRVAIRHRLVRRRRIIRQRRIVLTKVFAASWRLCDASTAEIARRREHCDDCEHRREGILLDSCGKCGCFIVLKTRLALEGCPAGRWGRVEPEQCAGFIRRLYASIAAESMSGRQTRPLKSAVNSGIADSTAPTDTAVDGNCGCSRKQTRSEDA